MLLQRPKLRKIYIVREKAVLPPGPGGALDTVQGRRRGGGEMEFNEIASIGNSTRIMKSSSRQHGRGHPRLHTIGKNSALE